MMIMRPTATSTLALIMVGGFLICGSSCSSHSSGSRPHSAGLQDDAYADEVRILVERLASTSHPEAQAAEERLIELGERSISRLKNAVESSEDISTRIRAGRALAVIEAQSMLGTKVGRELALASGAHGKLRVLLRNRELPLLREPSAGVRALISRFLVVELADAGQKNSLLREIARQGLRSTDDLLRTLLDDADVSVRRSALLSVGTVGAEQFVDKARSRCGDEDGSVRAAAGWSLMRIDAKGSVKQIGSLLSDSDASARFHGIWFAGLVGDNVHLGELRKLLRASDRKTRILSAWAIWCIEAAEDPKPRDSALREDFAAFVKVLGNLPAIDVEFPDDLPQIDAEFPDPAYYRSLDALRSELAAIALWIRGEAQEEEKLRLPYLWKAVGMFYHAASVSGYLASQFPAAKESKYRANYGSLSVLASYGKDHNELRSRFDQARERGEAPEWGGSRWGARLRALEGRVRSK